MRGKKTRSFYVDEELFSEVQHAAQRTRSSQSTVINKALSQFFSTQVTRSSWDTDDANSWYDEKKFYVYSQDKKGHSNQSRIWIPKNLAGLIGRVVNSGKIPEYRSPQDFYRDALFHRAHKIAEWIDDEELRDEITMQVLIAEEEMIARAKKDAEELIEKTRANLQEAWDDGDYAWVEDHVGTRIEKASGVPETYRDDYLKMLYGFREKLKVVHGGQVKSLQKRRRQLPETAN